MQRPVVVRSLSAFEILDSRSKPTVHVVMHLDDETVVEAGVPSGASTGSAEAVERRDGDPSRYAGQGVLGAVHAVEGELAALVTSREWASQRELDDAMRELDGTPNKARLGANAIVGVSMAAARAFATRRGVALYESLHADSGADALPLRMPVPHFNVVNGGAHAQNSLDFQEFMIAPTGATSMADAVRAGSEVYGVLRKALAAKGFPTGLGDEGGFAPDITAPEDVCAFLVDAIEQAGYRPGLDGVAIALDPAANGFAFPGGGYVVAGEKLTAEQMVARYKNLIHHYPVYLIEDGLAEDDRAGWQQLTRELGSELCLVGDDIFVTDPAVIARAAEDGIANASLIKVNQIGTVTETLDALATCRRVGYGAFISHRSGETPDDFIADLAVASGCGRLKTGAPARGERIAKYNRLMRISAENPSIPFGLA